MASIRKEFTIEAPAQDVWDAVRDVGAVHQRLTPGFVTNTYLEGEARVVTFANGLVVCELIVDVDDDARRLAYAAVEGRATHHHASIQVLPDGADRCRVLWVTDVLPDELRAEIASNVDRGAAIMKQTLERSLV